MVTRIIIFVILGDRYNNAPYCLQCMIPSSDKSSKPVMNGLFSYFNTEKLDSTTALP